MEDVKKFIFGFVNKEIKGEEREVFRPSKMDNRLVVGWWMIEMMIDVMS